MLLLSQWGTTDEAELAAGRDGTAIPERRSTLG
jgi:hypothetical protein